MNLKGTQYEQWQYINQRQKKIEYLEKENLSLQTRYFSEVSRLIEQNKNEKRQTEQIIMEKEYIKNQLISLQTQKEQQIRIMQDNFSQYTPRTSLSQNTIPEQISQINSQMLSGQRDIRESINVTQINNQPCEKNEILEPIDQWTQSIMTKGKQSLRSKSKNKK